MFVLIDQAIPAFCHSVKVVRRVHTKSISSFYNSRHQNTREPSSPVNYFPERKHFSRLYLSMDDSNICGV